MPRKYAMMDTDIHLSGMHRQQQQQQMALQIQQIQAQQQQLREQQMVMQQQQQRLMMQVASNDSRGRRGSAPPPVTFNNNSNNNINSDDLSLKQIIRERGNMTVTGTNAQSKELAGYSNRRLSALSAGKFSLDDDAMDPLTHEAISSSRSETMGMFHSPVSPMSPLPIPMAMGATAAGGAGGGGGGDENAMQTVQVVTSTPMPTDAGGGDDVEFGIGLDLAKDTETDSFLSMLTTGTQQEHDHHQQQQQGLVQPSTSAPESSFVTAMPVAVGTSFDDSSVPSLYQSHSRNDDAGGMMGESELFFASPTDNSDELFADSVWGDNGMAPTDSVSVTARVYPPPQQLQQGHDHNPQQQLLQQQQERNHRLEQERMQQELRENEQMQRHLRQQQRQLQLSLSRMNNDNNISNNNNTGVSTRQEGQPSADMLPPQPHSAHKLLGLGMAMDAASSASGASSAAEWNNGANAGGLSNNSDMAYNDRSGLLFNSNVYSQGSHSAQAFASFDNMTQQQQLSHLQQQSHWLSNNSSKNDSNTNNHNSNGINNNNNNNNNNVNSMGVAQDGVAYYGNNTTGSSSEVAYFAKPVHPPVALTAVTMSSASGDDRHQAAVAYHAQQPMVQSMPHFHAEPLNNAQLQQPPMMGMGMNATYGGIGNGVGGGMFGSFSTPSSPVHQTFVDDSDSDDGMSGGAFAMDMGFDDDDDGYLTN
eukprot:TRINITY_DN66028_c6_g15_i1.p1 TRINITY_DN66028_c6_g15~~TRINITY_DN66028_c6_g15_i1.p1  ORF type:complete len:813 (-),score=458.85 TRINITY_DN66028_c6_g15_i1:1811-3916(-)